MSRFIDTLFFCATIRASLRMQLKIQKVDSFGVSG
jgi:hypothetical protein